MRFEAIADPLDQVQAYQARATASGVVLPEAMALSTVDPSGHPRVRIVLFKGRNDRQVFFYTNYESDKARDLHNTPLAEICIHYAALELQARLSGTVTKTSAERSAAYFASRPRESQIGAWASSQSRPLARREQLDVAYEQAAQRFAGVEVPCPPHWGGFAITVDQVELWEGRSGRLHDRARYRFDGARWECQLLFP